LVNWSQEPEYGGLRAVFRPQTLASPKRIPPERQRVSVRVGGQDDLASLLSSLLGNGAHPSSSTVEIDRGHIPREVLAPHENPQTSPDISGRFFRVLVCVEPEFKGLFPSEVRPGDKAKNAWLMRDEFFNLELLEDGDWVWRLRRFLNRWGLWNDEDGFHTGMFIRTERPGFVLAFPHLLRQRCEGYRQALASKSARKWLSKARPLSFSTIDQPPYFLVERFYCEDAIQATITIDHLAGRRYGFCKRCGKQFERETEHKRQYCDRKCIQAANVANWRANKRKKVQVSEKGQTNAKG
jgi:hypothetical protein